MKQNRQNKQTKKTTLFFLSLAVLLVLLMTFLASAQADDSARGVPADEADVPLDDYGYSDSSSDGFGAYDYPVDDGIYDAYSDSNSAAAGFAVIFMIIWLIFIFGMFAVMIFFAVIWIIMLIDVIKRQKWNDDNEKIMWILIVVLLGGIGAIIYYFAIRRQRGPA